jgi:hypothetical protein
MLVGWIGAKRGRGYAHVLVLVEPRFLIPPEVFPFLLSEFAAPREQYGNSMESFEFFVGGGGGFGSINTPEKVSLNRMIVEYSFTPFSETTVRPRLGGARRLSSGGRSLAR